MSADRPSPGFSTKRRRGFRLRWAHKARLGWAVAAVAVVVAYFAFDWPGVALVLSVLAFWLTLQFMRALHVLHVAAQAPVGLVRNAVMLHAHLHDGMRLADILRMTHSLGHRVASDPETWAWADAHGDEVRVVVDGGRVVSWVLKRTPS